MKYGLFLAIFFAYIFIPLRSQQARPVSIGLLIQDKASLAARQGAELAVKLANGNRAGKACQFRLITKDMEGPWGTGSKQAVDLIFQDQVWALLGSHDGRNGHLVEQAATKSTVVFLSAWSSDPTLSQAFVPWFFNCVPNDMQQARELIAEIYNNRKYSRVVVISDKAYDSEQAFKSFVQSVKEAGKAEPERLIFQDSNPALEVLAGKVSKTKADCILLFSQPSSSLKIMQVFRQKKINLPVFGSLSILNENMLTGPELSEFNNRISVASGMWNSSKYRAFCQEYLKMYGKKPGMVAAYSFDGMNLLMEAIGLCGSSEVGKIQQALAEIRYEGVTGPIRFDIKGNREGNFTVLKTLNGLPGSLNAD